MNEIEKTLIVTIGNIYRKFWQEKKEQAVEFNLFELFSLRSAEALHSLFIAELLRPNGRHYNGDLFLKLFLDEFNIGDFEINDIIVVTEQFAGYIDEDFKEGGRIDILITNNKKQGIIIENKIFATDQYKQLVRYSNYAKQNNLNPSYIIYLTLFGSNPSQSSIVDENKRLEENIDYYKKSYQDNILNWLNNSLNQCSYNSVKETILQYINTIKILTKQSINDNMKTEIKKFITTNIQYFNSLEEIRNITDEIRNELSVQIINELNKKIINPIYKNNIDHISIHAEIINDGDGLQLAFWGINENKENVSKREESKKYVEVFHKLVHRNSYQFSGTPISWINFEDYYPNKLLLSDNNQICQLYNTDNRDNKNRRDQLIEKIIIETDKYIKEFIQNIDK